MTRKPEIEYVRYYSDGSAAKAVERRIQKNQEKMVVPKRSPRRKASAQIDTIAVLGTAAALVMLVCMLAGVVRLTITENKIAQAQTSVQVLQEENERLQLVYQDSYDLNAVESAAVSMGMIPREQAQHMQIRLPQPEQQERSVWEQWIDQLKELFA